MEPDEPTVRARREPPPNADPDPDAVPTAGESIDSRRPTPSLVSNVTGASLRREEGGASIERVRAVIDEGRLAVLRRFVWAMIAVSLMALPAALISPEALLEPGKLEVPESTRGMQILALVCIAALIFAYLYALKRATRTMPSGTSSALNLPLGLLGIGACVGLSVSFGIFAPLPFSALLALTIIYLGVASSMRDATLLYVLASLGFPLPMIFVITGVMEDQGIFQSEPPSQQMMILAVAGTEIAFAIAYMLGRTTANYGTHMMRRLDRAIRESSRREALLREVREDLERAVGIGGRGLFSELDLGNFVLGNVIGRGGMGEVYEATSRATGARAAVKLLRREVMADPDAVSRFEREARIAADLDSEHIVQVLEVGGIEAPVPFIAMEFLEGEDLASLLRARGRLPISQVVELIEQVAAGLDAAHEKGIIHRDLKPQNLFLTRAADGSRHWKILDFGVSKLLWGADATIGVGQLVGTPTYMSPEQAEGSAEIDARSDLYSLMVVVYRTLTGAQAFAKAATPAVLRAVREKMPADPKRFASIPEDLRRTLRIGLSKSPSDRFRSAPELAEAIRLAAHENLPEASRRRADALLQRRPWGSSGPVPSEDESTH